jgi:hypothetical protein
VQAHLRALLCGGERALLWLWFDSTLLSSPHLSFHCLQILPVASSTLCCTLRSQSFWPMPLLIRRSAQIRAFAVVVPRAFYVFRWCFATRLSPCFTLNIPPSRQHSRGTDCSAVDSLCSRRPSVCQCDIFDVQCYAICVHSIDLIYAIVIFSVSLLGRQRSCGRLWRRR